MSTTPPLPPPSSPLSTEIILEDTPIANDPPPPYPSPRRARRTRRQRQVDSQSHHSDYDVVPSSQHPHTRSFSLDDEPTETTPFLRPRPRSGSIFSSTSAAPSLAQTIASLFQSSDDEDEEEGEEEDGYQRVSEHNNTAENGLPHPYHHGRSWKVRWKRYWTPLFRSIYWKSLFHLTVLNFPYTLGAWIYLFVFTVTGTTLIVALPLGAILIFFDLIGARIFARGELALQTRFHLNGRGYPRQPIFTRLRDDVVDLEMGRMQAERSFYKNTYSMMTDPITYQSLFYFLVIKPAITIILSLLIIVFFVPMLVLVVSAPMSLRMVRKLGVWQAGVAIEGVGIPVS